MGLGASAFRSFRAHSSPDSSPTACLDASGPLSHRKRSQKTLLDPSRRISATEVGDHGPPGGDGTRLHRKPSFPSYTHASEGPGHDGLETQVFLADLANTVGRYSPRGMVGALRRNAPPHLSTLDQQHKQALAMISSKAPACPGLKSFISHY